MDTEVHGVWLCDPHLLGEIACRSLVVIPAERAFLTCSIKSLLFHSGSALLALLPTSALFHARLCKTIAILHLEIC